MLDTASDCDRSGSGAHLAVLLPPESEESEDMTDEETDVGEAGEPGGDPDDEQHESDIKAEKSLLSENTSTIHNYIP